MFRLLAWEKNRLRLTGGDGARARMARGNREFYTGWLTHWGEQIAETDANRTAAALEKILSRNGSAVLYVC
ncbi:hypothetical protein BHE74_00041266 [Ensete ventricosum]|nr:hypothetical protein GW17_00027197 [Ensete ventricosum]RWW52318.1 hypothetical protein BHE74_00041266 [Ensete ventricosum]RZS23746.1 hypothetical protein BHM03_00056727 [Ensete ventricosum]